MLAPLLVPHIVEQIAAEVRSRGGRALLVGGSVRDWLLGASDVTDWDIEVHGLSLSALESTLRRFGRVDQVGRAFSVLKLWTHGLELDVSLPRRDSKVGPGHRGIHVDGDPNLSIKEAFRRRDLTINAMGVDLHTRALIDLYDGVEDLKARRLRAVDPETFLEDPLRALRAVQFAARFDASADQTLIALCAQAALQELPAERLQAEWVKLLLRGRRPSRGLQLARASGQLRLLFPMLSECPPPDVALDAAVAWRDDLHSEARGLAAMLAVWLYPAPQPERLAALDVLGLTRWMGVPVRALALDAAQHAGDDVHDAASLRWLSTRADVQLALGVREVFGIGMDDVGEIRAMAAKLDLFAGPPTAWIRGADILSAGFKPGRQVGVLMEQAYHKQLDGAFACREDAYRWLRAQQEMAGLS